MSVFSQPAFTTWFRAGLEAQFKEAAEPLIQYAVKEFEKEVRKIVGKAAVTLITDSFSVERFGPDLRITVKVGE